jgi:hypothetical protein
MWPPVANELPRCKSLKFPGKEGRRLLKRRIVLSQLPVLTFKLPDALLFRSKRFALTGASTFRIVLGHPAPHGCLNKVHRAADFADR